MAAGFGGCPNQRQCRSAARKQMCPPKSEFIRRSRPTSPNKKSGCLGIIPLRHVMHKCSLRLDSTLLGGSGTTREKVKERSKDVRRRPCKDTTARTARDGCRADAPQRCVGPITKAQRPFCKQDICTAGRRARSPDFWRGNQWKGSISHLHCCAGRYCFRLWQVDRRDCGVVYCDAEWPERSGCGWLTHKAHAQEAHKLLRKTVRRQAHQFPLVRERVLELKRAEVGEVKLPTLADIAS